MNKKFIISIAILVLSMMLSIIVGAQEGTTPFLGVGVQESDEGALVVQIVPDSPADAAGLQVGDIITAVNGTDVTAQTLAPEIQSLEVGDTVTLDILRDGETLELEAELAARPPEEPRQPNNQQPPPRGSQPYLGVSIAQSNDGVVIRQVQPNSPADEAGLQAGDILVSINDTAVERREDAFNVIRSTQPGDVLTVEVTRDGETVTTEVTVGGISNDRPLNIPQIPLPLDVVVYNSENESWQVFGLSADSPLAEAGLQPGDVITEIDGEVYSPESLTEYLAGVEDDAEVTLTVERQGQTQELSVPASALASINTFDLPARQMPPGQPFDFNMMPGSVRLGVAFETLNEQIAEDNNLDVTEGALITEVMPDTPAAEAGLQVDDVVLAVEGDPVDARRTLRERLFAYEPGETVTLDILRDGENLSIDVTLAEGGMSDNRMPRFDRDGGMMNIIPRLFGLGGMPGRQHLPDHFAETNL